MGWLTPRQWGVLWGIRNGLVSRDFLYGDLAPWLLGGRPVDWPLAGLVLRGLVRLDPLGWSPPALTGRGRQVVNGHADRCPSSAGWGCRGGCW